MQTSSPLRLNSHPINEIGDWYKWSDDFRKVLLELRKVIATAEAPQLINLYEGKPYARTYTIRTKLADCGLHEEILQSARYLYQMQNIRRPIFLTQLLDDEISSEMLRYLFSYYQYCFGLISGKPDTAMYAPLGDLSETGFPFPLHSDLYLQQFLLVVFDVIPVDDSGQTLLISTERFLETIRHLKTMPKESKAHIEELLIGEVSSDRFDDFFYFLYRKDAPWMEELSVALEARQIMVKFQRGEGFFVDDRRWLHGRTAPNSAVHEDRLHRLVFNVWRPE